MTDKEKSEAKTEDKNSEQRSEDPQIIFTDDLVEKRELQEATNVEEIWNDKKKLETYLDSILPVRIQVEGLKVNEKKGRILLTKIAGLKTMTYETLFQYKKGPVSATIKGNKELVIYMHKEANRNHPDIEVPQKVANPKNLIRVSIWQNGERKEYSLSQLIDFKRFPATPRKRKQKEEDDEVSNETEEREEKKKEKKKEKVKKVKDPLILYETFGQKIAEGLCLASNLGEDYAPKLVGQILKFLQKKDEDE